VPEQTKQKYLQASTEKIIVSKKLDGMPQRMINNPCLQKLQKISSAGMLLLAVKNGLAFSKMTGGSLLSVLSSAWKMKRSNGLSFAQTIMAANAPMMIQEAMVAGHPDQGILPSGQIAGAIENLPSGEELIHSIVSEAQQTLTKLSALQAANSQES
jgi:NAD(P)H-dependent flavin oxidoreductase YrpB (nitropropane dioxygenase family)